MTQEEKRRIGEMRAVGCSYIRIAAALNISVNSIKSYCRRHSLGEGMIRQEAQAVQETHVLPDSFDPVSQEVTPCEQCGSPVHQIAGRKHRRFCSEPCRLAWWAAHRSQMNIWTFDGKGELMLTIMSSLAQEESRSISENCAWGQRKRFADGKVSVPFGRFLGYDRGPDGNLVVNEEQAKVVRRIYAEFLRGYTPYAIANHLTADGIPTPGGKTVWGKGVVLSILTNEKYKGDALLQKVFTEDFISKKKVKNTEQVPQYYVEGNHEAIVSAETFDLVQEQIAARKPGANRYSGVHLFSGIVYCGDCGSLYGSKVWHATDKYRKVVWQCNHKYEGAICRSPHLTEPELEAIVIKAMGRLSDDREEIIRTAEMLRATIRPRGLPHSGGTHHGV